MRNRRRSYRPAGLVPVLREALSESQGGKNTDTGPVFATALKAGAEAVFPVGDQHGWRSGRVVDPYGHHWEIGRPVVA